MDAMNLVEKSAVRVIMTGPRWVINNFGLMVLMPILLLSVPCLSRAAEVSFTNVTQAAGIAYIGESWGGRGEISIMMAIWISG